MVKEGNSKVTLSLSTPIYDSFRKHCQEEAILISKKVEIWMDREVRGNPVYPGGLSHPIVLGKNKKVTLSIDTSVYHSFQNYCELNAVMLSRKIEIWMTKEVESEAKKEQSMKEDIGRENKKEPVRKEKSA